MPVLCLGLLAPLAPRLAGRLGLERALIVTLLVLLAGLLLRVVAGAATLFAGTVAAAGGIAVANVLVPALVKRDYPQRKGTMMGIHTMCLTGFAALAAGATIPAGEVLRAGWRGALGAWAALAVLAILVWIPLSRGGAAPAGRPAPPRRRASGVTRWHGE